MELKFQNKNKDCIFSRCSSILQWSRLFPKIETKNHCKMQKIKPSINLRFLRLIYFCSIVGNLLYWILNRSFERYDYQISILAMKMKLKKRELSTCIVFTRFVCNRCQPLGTIKFPEFYFLFFSAGKRLKILIKN